MTTKYEVTKIYCDTEEDVYNEGCTPNSGTRFDMDVKISADTVEELVKKLFAEIGAKYDIDAVELDACDELGRIDIQTMNDEHNEEADAADLASWKAGSLRLWAATYTARVERVTRETVSVSLRGGR